MFSLPDSSLFIGITTRVLLDKLERDGDITSREKAQFFETVQQYYFKATEYALTHLPLKDKVLMNAGFISFEKRESSLFSQVEFFIERYSYRYYCTHEMYMQVSFSPPLFFTN